MVSHSRALSIVFPEEGQSGVSDFVVPRCGFQVTDEPIIGHFLQQSKRRSLAKCRSLAREVNKNDLWRERQPRIPKNSKDCGLSLRFGHYQSGPMHTTRGHRNSQIRYRNCQSNIDIATWRYLVPNFNMGAPHILTTNRRNKARITMDGYGPCGPAVVEVQT